MTPRQDPEYLETVSLIAENAEQAATIASQAARIAELEAALKSAAWQIEYVCGRGYVGNLKRDQAENDALKVAKEVRALLAQKG